MHNIRLAVFDMAGTTINENNIVYKTVQQVLNEAGFDISLEQVLQFGAGKEKQQAILDILTMCTDLAHPEPIAKSLFAKFTPALETAYEQANIHGTEGAEAIFKTLRNRGIKVVLNTGYDRVTACSLLSKLHWQAGREFDALLTSTDVQNGRPHPEMIYLAMEMFGVTTAHDVLKAGDSAIDIEEGKNAGCGVTVGVLGGAQNREQLAAANPDYIVESLMELENILAHPSNK